MLIARTHSWLVLGIMLSVAGCALPHAGHRQPVPAEAKASAERPPASQKNAETLIRVDHEGNVYRNDDATTAAEPTDNATTAPLASARRTSAKHTDDGSITKTTSAQGNYTELASAIGEPKIDAERVAELVAAHERTAAREVDTVPAVSLVMIANGNALDAMTNEQAPVAAVPKNVSLPAGVFPTVVRTTRFELEYDDQVLGEQGIAKVELYGTRDAGRTWDKLGEDADRRSPYTVEMPEEGVFGFRIAVAGKNGLASRAPKNGELPELWVRVDLSEPMFRANLRPAGDAAGQAHPELTASSPSDHTIDASVVTAATPTAEQTSGVAQASHVAEITAAPPGDWRSHLAQAIAAAETALPDATADEQARLSAHLRMLYLAADRHDEAIKSSAHHDSDQNQFWSHQMHGLKLLVEPTQAPAARQASAALAELREASDKLAALSELQVNSLSFCTAANSFGVYETKIEASSWKHNDYAQRKFEPEQPIVLYFEVDNFACEQTVSREHPDGAWRTSLRGSYTIVDGSGSPVDERELKLKDDLCRNRRHDYYVAYKSWIPKLNPGQYSLELLVEDTIAGKIGTSSIDFEVVAR